MFVHNFEFVLKDNHKDSGSAKFLSHPAFKDATLAFSNRAHVVSFSRKAETYKEAVLSAYYDLRDAGVEIISFEPENLVNASEIAKRAGVSQGAVSKYIIHDVTFPTPTRMVRSKRALYDWVEVSRWFCDRRKLSIVEHQKAIVARLINLVAQADRASVHLELSELFD